MTWLIYKHTLTVDCPHKGWSYIGQTSKSDPTGRWRKDGSGYFSYTQTGQLLVFAKAIEKYGWENFSHEILEDDIPTLQEANARERYWIDYYHTYVNDPNCAGYNMTRGGDGSVGFKHSEETKSLIKQRVSEAFPDGRYGKNHPMYGKHHTEETKRKISNSKLKNPNNGRLGKTLSEETKEKLRVANLGKRLTDEQKEIFAQKRNKTLKENGTDIIRWVSVNQYDLAGNFIKTWPKMRDASYTLNIPQGNITKVCQGIRKYAGGYIWRYTNATQAK